MAGISFDKAQLLTVVLECMVYGLFLAFFVAATYFLVAKHAKIGTCLPLLFTAILMFLTATAQISVHLAMTFATYSDLFSSDITAMHRYLTASKPYNVAQAALVIIQVLIGDTFLIYRCFVFCGRRKRMIIFPFILLLGTAASGFGQSAMLARVIPGTEDFRVSGKPWITATAVTTFCTNALCTGLIAYKLRATQKHLIQRQMCEPSISSGGFVRRQDGRETHFALMIVVESAAIYLIAVATILILHLVGSNGEGVLTNMLPSLIGITFTAIIIRISLGLSTIDREMESQPNMWRGPPHFRTFQGPRHLCGDEYEMSTSASTSMRAYPIAVHVDRFTEADKSNVKFDIAKKYAV